MRREIEVVEDGSGLHPGQDEVVREERVDRLVALGRAISDLITAFLGKVEPFRETRRQLSALSNQQEQKLTADS